jgi:endoglycosylceramidase
MRNPLILALALTAATRAFASGALHVDGNTFRDAQNAVVILRGMNVAGNSKVPPFMPITDVALLDPLPKWGLNAIRLLFTWEAFEPQQGQDSADYLQYIRRVVEAAHARGIYVVIDFHQDGYSRYALEGCGEGFPSWALPPGITPATPDNGPNCKDWGTRTVGDAMLAATWKGFYSDGSGVRTAFVAMLGRVAAALSDEPGVIGYDILNEPAGDEVTQVAPLYEDGAKAIRAADANAILFIEPIAIDDPGSATKLPKPTFANFAFAPHFYDATLTVGAWSGSDESSQMATLASAAATWNVPVFLGEFGAPPGLDQVDGYLGAVEQQLLRNFWSSAQWAYTPGWNPTSKDGWNVEDFSIVDDKGQPRANYRPRPSPERIAGTPKSLVLFDGKTPSASTLTLAWHHDPAAGATQLFAPLEYFGGSISVATTGGLQCNVAGALVSCTSSTSGDKQVKIGNGSNCGLTGAEALLVAWLITRRRRRARY